jgi:predicted DNA-binding transcriptional regulator AlpA
MPMEEVVQESVVKEFLPMEPPVEEKDTLIRAKEVAKILGVSVSTVYKIMGQQEEFPRPIALSERTVVWSKKEIFDWIEFKKTQPRHTTLFGSGASKKPNLVNKAV